MHNERLDKVLTTLQGAVIEWSKNSSCKAAFKRANRNPENAEDYMIPIVTRIDIQKYSLYKIEKVGVLMAFLYVNKFGYFTSSENDIGTVFNSIDKLNKSNVSTFHKICQASSFDDIVTKIYRNIKFMGQFDVKLDIMHLAHDLYWFDRYESRSRSVRSWKRSFKNALSV